MCTAVNGHFKILIGYFFISGLNGPERANLMQIALQKVHTAGARSLSITCDGASANLAMFRELGACLDPERLKPFFPHPSDPSHRVFSFLDVVHAIKLVRNTLATLGVIVSPSGQVRWHFIRKLHDLQTKEGLRAGTKLSRRHIEWDKSKMKVSRAAQTLSRSVADAIDFCREDLKLQEFQGSEATTEFIRYKYFMSDWD